MWYPHLARTRWPESADPYMKSAWRVEKNYYSSQNITTSQVIVIMTAIISKGLCSKQMAQQVFIIFYTRATTLGKKRQSTTIAF